MNRAKLLAAAAVLGLWALPSSAASLTPEDAEDHFDRGRTTACPLSDVEAIADVGAKGNR